MLITRELGEIWKVKARQWKVKCPHGIETCTIKARALQYRKSFFDVIIKDFFRKPIDNY